ncbi:hypothetical protein HK100_003093 [Physocladia obscura]|uniref:Uncharacterized protein n=1 Tax=Physocladia obscura TaxID=109957 RepID=A0AAD5T7X2_9FUNG|nr:hypothetical protein HK100_003093 [Physocladia obscura]
MSFVVFSDFDGTITTVDTGNVIIDSAMGKVERMRLDAAILDGTITYREGNNAMWAAVRFPAFDDAITVCHANNITLDPHFPRFHALLDSLGVLPLKVVSAGLDPIVKLYLRDFSGIEIFANCCEISNDGSWRLIYVDDSPFGHDKGAPIRRLKQLFIQQGLTEQTRPLILFIGDGVSDLSAARDADVVFAKDGKDLATYCRREGITENLVLWSDFGQICQWIEKEEWKKLSRG